MRRIGNARRWFTSTPLARISSTAVLLVLRGVLHPLEARSPEPRTADHRGADASRGDTASCRTRSAGAPSRNGRSAATSRSHAHASQRTDAEH
jgi:hypothetical protein